MELMRLTKLKVRMQLRQKKIELTQPETKMLDKKAVSDNKIIKEIDPNM
jgi:hypothetical protein